MLTVLHSARKLSALQAVSGVERGFEIEVEIYRFRRPKRIVRRPNLLRRLNGLL